MWIQARSMDATLTHKLDGLSKLTSIKQIRDDLAEIFGKCENPEEKKNQKIVLFYRGKQLEDSHTLFDYDVRQNDLVQVLVRKNLPPVPDKKVEEPGSDKESLSDKENVEPVSSSSTDQPSASSSHENALYKLGDIIDARDAEVGSWDEVTISKIVQSTEEENAKLKSPEENDEAFPRRPVADAYVYHVLYNGYENDGDVEIRSDNMRPRARTNISFSDVSTEDRVMVNYNMEEPKKRGYWYDAVVTGKKETRTVKELLCTIYFGADLAPLHDCKIIFTKEIFAIEAYETQKNIHIDGVTATPTKRVSKPDCDICLDVPTVDCKACACHQCGGKKDPTLQIICDECDAAWHIYCLTPKLDSVPDVDEWFCPLCKNDETEVVRAGEKLKVSKKKQKMVSASSTKTRDWGKGMACVGRTKMCTIVPSNHFGPIPGVEVGQSWLYRVQVSEAGIHRPHVAGIHGRSQEGAYSIALAGGYEDDVDSGETFTFTGSGGRDLSGNKRTAEQSMDQKLTHFNLAIARNCDAPVDAKKGAKAKDWRKGKPIRVVRGYKCKEVKYAPEKGNRYDGIYKVVRYWPEKGQAGFLVWRYELRRDDNTPAPWTKAGKKRIAELGLEMIYPEGYEEKKAEEAGTKKKRKSTAGEDDAADSSPKKKKAKVATYKPEAEIKKCIKEDVANKKLWDEIMATAKEGKQVFLNKVQELFACICCQDLVHQPVTTECAHNICKNCLQRSFKAGVFTCASCRFELGKGYEMKVNKPLSTTLLAMFPGYGTGN